MREATAAVSPLLEQELPRLYEIDREVGRAALRLKRDIFNGRRVAIAACEKVLRHLLPLQQEAVRALAARIDAHERLESDLSAAYADELKQGYDEALRWMAHPGLARSIEITNPALYAQLEGLRAGKPLGAKTVKLICTSLARYVSRAARKTSPLARFGSVAVGRWTSALPTNLMPITLPDRADCRVDLRAAAIEHAVRKLLHRLDSVGGQAPVRLTGSLRAVAEGYAWSRIEVDDIPEARAQGNRVSLMSSKAPFVLLLDRQFAASGCRTLAELREELGAILADRDGSRVDALLRSAWQEGLLICAVPESEDLITWAKSAVDCLRPTMKAPLIDALDALDAAVRGAEPAYSVERHFSAFLQAAAVELPSERFRPLLFEDCTQEPGNFELPLDLLGGFRTEFTLLLRLTPLLEYMGGLSRGRRAVEAAFRERFGAAGTCRDVAGFLDDFVRSARTDDRQPPRDDPDDATMRELGERLARLLSGEGQSGPLDCDPEALRKICDSIPASFLDRRISQMFFLQAAGPGDSPALVLNHLFAGAGCLVTRFLPDHPEYLEPVREYLSHLTDGRDWAELSASFGFNGSRHPRLASRTIAIPPFDGTQAPGTAGNLSLDQLSLRMSDKNGRLELRGPDGPVSVFYLGLLTPVLLPEVHRAFLSLCFETYSHGEFWTWLATRAVPDGEGVRIVPRINLGNLVLTRRTVAVPAERLPQAELEGYAFFRQFNAWADGIGLPRHNFFQRKDLGASNSDESADRSRMRKVQRLTKPLPLDRHCPIDVRILQRSLGSSDLPVQFVEALPGPGEGGARLGNETVTAEFGIELALDLPG